MPNSLRPALTDGLPNQKLETSTLKNFIAEFQKSDKANQRGQLSLCPKKNEVPRELFGVANIEVGIYT